MRQRNWVLFAVSLCLALSLASPVYAVNELTIACEGTESSGGGATQYQYALTNPSATPIPVDYFYIGTFDLAQADYSAWVAPPGFTAVGTVGTYAFLDGTFPITFSGMGSTAGKTPHQVVPPQIAVGTPGAIVWQCTQPIPGGPCDLNPGMTFTFGFDNSSPSVDAQWLVDGPIPTVGMIVPPIAGPLGTYTSGWVHSPSDSAGVPDIGVWGRGVLFGGLALLLAGAVVFWLRRT